MSAPEALAEIKAHHVKLQSDSKVKETHHETLWTQKNVRLLPPITAKRDVVIPGPQSSQSYGTSEPNFAVCFTLLHARGRRQPTDVSRVKTQPLQTLCHVFFDLLRLSRSVKLLISGLSLKPGASSGRSVFGLRAIPKNICLKAKDGV